MHSLWMTMPWGLFHQHGLTLISTWISHYIHYKVWDEIMYPFPNLNGCTIEVCGNGKVISSHTLLDMWLLIHETHHIWMKSHVCPTHNDVITWKSFLYCWPFVSVIHQSQVGSLINRHWSWVDSPHKGPVMQTFDDFWQTIEQTLKFLPM